RANVHARIDTYREPGDRLAKSEAWGGDFVSANSPYLGVQGDPDAKDCTISKVQQGSPAEKAGLKENDVVMKIDGQKVEKFDDLGNVIRKKKPGDEVTIDVLRGTETLSLKVKLGRRS